MKIVIRCDAGGEFGYGHGVRMRALAQALAARGATVRFLTTTPALAPFVAPMVCHGVRERVACQSTDMLILDTKAPLAHAERPLRALRQHGVKVVHIDNPGASVLTCDLLIGPVNHWPPDTVETLRAAFGDRFLYGWDYVMLDSEITAQQPIPYAQRRQEQIMFCAGGTDPENAREQMCQWVQDLDVDVPLYFPPLGNADAYRNGLRESALVVGMFGVSTYEGLWYKTPQIVFSRSSADILGAHELQERTGHRLCSAAFFRAYIPTIFCSLIRDIYYASIRACDEIPSFIDGQGTQRVAEAILAL